MRYVALEGDVWVGLVGFGSAALSLAARESYVGWSEQVKNRRLRYVVNNQRFCVLPDGRRPNVASAVLARTLRRLSGDFEAAYGHPVLLVETFTDPARHSGVCYQAANFVSVGETSGYHTNCQVVGSARLGASARARGTAWRRRPAATSSQPGWLSSPPIAVRPAPPLAQQPIAPLHRSPERP